MLPLLCLAYGRRSMPNEKSVLHLGLGYLYVLLAGIAAVLGGFMWRDVYRLALIRAELHRYTIHVNVLFVTFGVGIVSLIVLVILEHYFRQAASLQVQFYRLLKVLVFPLFLTAGAHLLQWGLIFWGAQYFDTFRFLAAGFELALGVILWVTARRRLRAELQV